MKQLPISGPISAAPRGFGAGAAPPSFLAAAALVLLLAPGKALAITQEDQVFFEFLVKEMGYLDTASRWIASLEARASDKRDQCEILYWKIVIADLGKDADTASQLREELRKRCPDHQRVALGGLSAIISPLTQVTDLLDKASGIADKARAAAALSEAVKKFTEEVEKPLDALISSLNSQIEEVKKKEREERLKDKTRKAKPKSQSPVATLLFARDTAEVARLKIHLLYARKLPLDHPARKAALEKGYKLAEEFVDRRFDFFDLQYDGQLQKGIYLYELGRHQAAHENLQILFDALPPGNPPFDAGLVSFFKNLHLQAILFGSRARNAAQKFEEAAAELQKHFVRPSKDQFDLSGASQANEGDLRQLAILTRLEYGVALAGSGKPREGLDLIQRVIREERDEGLVTDARKALGRVASLGRVKLRARDYYQAAIGLKSAYLLEQAIATLQLALASLTPRDVKEVDEIAPLCLNEIGEVNYMLDRPYESLLAYQEFAKVFGLKENAVTGKVAQNFLAVARHVIDKIEGNATHSALAKIKAEAEAFSRKWSGEGDFAIYLSIMADASNLEGQGKYDAARAKYLEVPKQSKGKSLPFYWRAQALAHACAYREWDRADEAGKKRLDPELAKAINALKGIVPQAIKEKDLIGAAIACLIQGQVHYQRNEYHEAVRALSPFRAALATEQVYRVYGLGSLVLASVRMADCAQAEKDFDLLEKAALNAPGPQEDQIATAALELSDCFDGAGDFKKAARYMLAYLKQPSSKADLTALDSVVLAAARLVRGGYAQDGRKLLSDFAGDAKKGGAEEAELSRQLALLDARTLAAEKKWDEAIARFDGFLKKYPAMGDHRDDPYVLRDFAEAYLGRAKSANQQQKKNGKNAPAANRKSDLESADQLYGGACGLLKRLLEFEKRLEPTYWKWIYRLLEVKMMQGGTASHRVVVEYIDREKTGDMGGLKEKFLKLREEAAAKIEEDSLPPTSPAKSAPKVPGKVQPGG